MKTSELYNKTNYLLNVPYLSSTYITEYDLSKANISALKYMGYLSDEDYNFLYNADKLYREVYIGKLERVDKKVSDLKKQGILEARKKLFFKNNLQDSEILSIKNDAVFIIGDRPIVNSFDIFKFNIKNRYTFFMVTTNKLEIYYKYDPISGEEIFDVKGINDNILEYHRNYMISFLCQIFYLLQTNTVEYTLRYFNDFYEKFVNFRLDSGYYREFDCYSMYRVNRPEKNISFGLPYIDNETIRNSINNKLIDINCNTLLLRDVYSVLADLYFNSRKN